MRNGRPYSTIKRITIDQPEKVVPEISIEEQNDEKFEKLFDEWDWDEVEERYIVGSYFVINSVIRKYYIIKIDDNITFLKYRQQEVGKMKKELFDNHLNNGYIRIIS